MKRFFLSLAVLLLAGPVSAASPSKREADIARVEAYLSGITSIVAEFNQVDVKGNLAKGTFYLKRPGKMRWQYEPPTPVLLVCDGSVLTYYDAELDQVNYIGVDDTLATFLARPRISLDSASTKLTSFSSGQGVIRATIVQAKKPDEGSLTLELSDSPLQIRRMVVTDANGNATQVALSNAKFGEELPDSLFKFEDPRGRQQRRSK